ncbi:MAG: 6-phosphogluconolactonase [Pseudomonadota bacterium]|nr:6-phosphogluconolactonase [Pseudomonadota bacterium]
MHEVHRFEDASTLHLSLAEQLASALVNGAERRGSATLVVSGGRTPIPLFHALRQQPIPWNRIQVSLADDRWVPAHHPDSNEGLVRRELLVGRASEAELVGLTSTAPDPRQGHIDSEAAVARLNQPFDAVVLGMGGDGHTASLFPGSPDLHRGLSSEADLTIPVTPPAGVPHLRVSMTLRTLLNARGVYLHIEGADKWQRYLEARQQGPVEQYPVRALLEQSSAPLHVYWAP